MGLTYVVHRTSWNSDLVDIRYPKIKIYEMTCEFKIFSTLRSGINVWTGGFGKISKHTRDSVTKLDTVKKFKDLDTDCQDLWEFDIIDL